MDKETIYLPGKGWHREGDLSYSEVRLRAEELVRQGMHVYFKCTCQHCQARITGAEPNKIYRRYECVGCGKETRPFAYGFMATNILL